MGDDYESLGQDMLQEVAELLDDKGGKAAKKMRRLERLYAEWRRRESSFRSYRTLELDHNCTNKSGHIWETWPDGQVRCFECDAVKVSEF